MSDFIQQGQITTLHGLQTASRAELESRLADETKHHKIGLVLPLTGLDMKAPPFRRIINELRSAGYLEKIVVVLNAAPHDHQYRETKTKLERFDELKDKAEVVWTDGQRVQRLYAKLRARGFTLDVAGKGRSVWTAFGYLLCYPQLRTFVLHDCDIRRYDRGMLARLALPMVLPSLDFEFCKAYYARVEDRMYGRVVRLLVTPFVNALMTLLGGDPFLTFLSSFRYPLSGEFAISSTLARSNRVPCDWGLEIGTLAEVFRNTSVKRVCQVDLCRPYEHKHRELEPEQPERGLMMMATDILTSIFRTLASRGAVVNSSQLNTLQAAYLRLAQDCIRQYHADSEVNRLSYDRDLEERAVEAFTRQIRRAGSFFLRDPSGEKLTPNWVRVLACLPTFPEELQAAAEGDAKQFARSS
jgi:glucosyl-3-phosphoglycerate synthase